MGRKFTRQALAIIMLAAAAALPPVAAQAARLKVIYTFAGPGGGNPAGNMVYYRGKLYGTTAYSSTGDDTGGLFVLDPKSRIETQLHVFSGGTDGLMPVSGVVEHAGILYGTTSQGGSGSGTVFQYDVATGAEKTLYVFPSSPGIGASNGGLVYFNGALYGTSEYGGATRQGAVFKIDATTGAATLLHSFTGHTDGARPVTGLAAGNGVLYGTTLFGGSHSCINQTGCGTIFAIAPDTGAASVLYRFAGGDDGSRPSATLTVQDGVLYGVTSEGGGTDCFVNRGCGTAFRLDPNTGAETVLHRFTGGADGKAPVGTLTYLNGTLYGTTFFGGQGGCGGEGCGTIYSLDPATGAETVLFPLHIKTGDGPTFGLTVHDDIVFGATVDGGFHCAYCGTVFEFKL